jgi:MoaA/NifB/PqqE/SkfB family radical SAM enzyme
MRDVVRTLFDVLRYGQFLHAPDEDSCKYCDFKRVCGGIDIATDRAQRKRSGELTKAPELAAIRKLVQQ